MNLTSDLEGVAFPFSNGRAPRRSGGCPSWCGRGKSAAYGTYRAILAQESPIFNPKSL